MLIVLQVMLIVWACFVGWLIGCSIHCAIESYKAKKMTQKLLLWQLQRQNEELTKMLEELRKEIE